MFMMAKSAFLLPKRKVASSGITVVGAFENSSSGGSLSVSLSGTASGDVCYAFQSGATSSGTPTGYTQIGSYVFDVSGGVYLNVSRKTFSSADTTVSFPSASTNYGSACAALVLRGVNATPEDAAITSLTDQPSSQPDSPSITTVTANALIISAFGAVVNADGTYTQPSGYTLQNDLFGDGAVGSGLGIATVVASSPGSYDPGAWSGVSLGWHWSAITMAIRPA